MLEFDYLDSIDTKEESLVIAFEQYLESNKNENFLIMKELDCWQGRADIVRVYFQKPISLEVEKAKIITNLTNAKIISLLHYNAPRTFEYLKKRTGLSDSTLKKSISLLLSLEIIELTKNNNFVLNANFKLPKVTFDAYEAKLSNWKRALYQALQYRGFANTSSVIMPSKYIENALRYKEGFEANGIGLVEVKSDGQVKKHVKPKKYQPRRKDFYLVGIGKFILELNLRVYDHFEIT